MDSFLIALLLKPFIGIVIVAFLLGTARLGAMMLRPLLPDYFYRSAANPKGAKNPDSNPPLISREP